MKTILVLVVVVIVGSGIFGYREYSANKFKKEFNVSMYPRTDIEIAAIKPAIMRQLGASFRDINIYAGEIKFAQAQADSLPANTSTEIQARVAALQGIARMNASLQNMVDVYLHKVDVAYDADVIGDWCEYDSCRIDVAQYRPELIGGPGL